MIKLSKCTKEEEKAYWLQSAQWWSKQSKIWLGYNNPIEALMCFVRAIERMAWGLGSEERF